MTGLTIRCMVKVSFLGTMAGNIRESTSTTRRKVEEYLCGLMVDNMMECGKTVSKKDLESTATPRVRYVMESGPMEREVSGSLNKNT